MTTIPRYVVSDNRGVRTEGSIRVPTPPTMPASLAVLVTLLGLGLVYWSLTGLGLLRAADAPVIDQSGTTGDPSSSGGGGGGKPALLS